jgi:hypothetical protein
MTIGMVNSDTSAAASNIPSFHDGLLTSLAVEKNEAVIGIRRTNGTAFKLTLECVEALHAADFREGNIIDNVEVIHGKAPEGVGLNERLERLFPSPHASAAAEYHERYADFLRGVLGRITTGEAKMVIIESSYGCDLVAVCRDAKLAKMVD